MENVTKTNTNTKTCKYCKMQIPIGAKVCPHCRKKQSGNGVWIALVVVAFLFVFGMANDDSDEKVNNDNNTENVGGTENLNDTETESQEQITYVSYTVDEMMDLLNENALKAEKQYQDSYVEVTGILEVIDSDGKYISLGYTDGTWSIVNVQCYLQNEEQVDKVLEMKTGDTVTLRGKITSVGEVIGYHLDIDSID